MAPSLRRLAKGERFCRDSLTNLAQLVDSYQEDRDRIMLEGWKERLEEIFQEYKDARLQLELSDDFQSNLKQKLEADALQQSQAGLEVEPQSTEQVNRDARVTFESTYLRLKGSILSKIRANADGQRQIAPVQVPVQQIRVKLPEIKLPSFDGNIKDWPAFRDSFRSLIASNPQLSNVDKFSYLLSTLSKEAKRVVEVIEVTSDNYVVAWDLLEKRYENKYLIVKSYVEALFTADPVKRECHESLNRLIDTFERNLMMLEKAGEQPENWSTLLVFMLCSRLDPATLRHWETHRKSTQVPTYTDLIAFLRSHSLVLQSIDASKGRSSDFSRSSTQRPPSQATKPNLAHSAVTAQKSCPFCKQSAHSPYQCEVFRKMTPTQRFDATKRNALCINCLSPSHLVKACTSGTCRICQQRHHTMLHQRPAVPSNQPFQPTIKSSDSQSSSSSVPINRSHFVQPNKQPLPTETQTQATAVPAPQTSHFSMPFTEAEPLVPATVLLSTALVKVFTSSGCCVWARALLDSGSQLNFVSEHLAQNLKLRRTKEFVPISGVGLSSTSSKQTTTIRIQSHCADFEENWKFHVLSKLTLELPNQAVDVSRSSWPSDVVLADPTFDRPGSIDLILGAGIFYDLLRDGQIKNGRGEPVLQNTALGWVVSGKVPAKISAVSVSNVASITPSPSIDDQLARFWEIESCHIQSTHSVEEAECEAFFRKNDSTRFYWSFRCRPTDQTVGDLQAWRF